MPNPWDEFEDAAEAPSAANPWDAFEDAQDDVPPQWEAAARGAAQGATFSLADEGQAFLRASRDQLLGDLPSEAAPGADAYGVYDPATVAEPAEPTAFRKRYEQYRDTYRAGDAAAEEAHPVTSFLSSLAGSAVLPLGTAANVARTAKLGTKVLQGAKAGAKVGAATGALTGFGRTEELDEPTQVLLDVAEGTATGAAGAPPWHVGVASMCVASCSAVTNGHAHDLHENLAAASFSAS